RSRWSWSRAGPPPAASGRRCRTRGRRRPTTGSSTEPPSRPASCGRPPSRQASTRRRPLQPNLCHADPPWSCSPPPAGGVGLLREGPFYPDHGLERIVAYHQRQDARFAAAAAAAAESTGKPVLTATELAVVDPDNPGPAGVRASGHMCYPSADRAVAALAHLY